MAFIQTTPPSEAIGEVRAMYERQQAKLDKNYARADEIRQHLLQRGVVLEDSRDGTKWRRGARD